MKKLLVTLISLIVISASCFVPVSAAENLCDKLSVVYEFHNLYNTYFNPDPDIGGLLEREVKIGELYSPSIIIGAAEMIYLENPSKYTLVKTPERDPSDYTSPIVVQRPYGQYICVTKNEYFAFVKKHFEVSDSLLNELQNFKVKDFTTEYYENGSAIYNATNNTFIVPVLEDRENTLRLNTLREFVGYSENGDYYDVYLNHKKNENDYMKYTVSYNNSVIKYISNVKVNSLPADLIKPGDVVPDKPAVPTKSEVVSVESSKPVQSGESQTASSVEEKTDEVESEPETTDETSSEILTTGAEETETKKDIDNVSIKPKTNYLTFIIIGIVVIIVAAALVYFFLLRKKI